MNILLINHYAGSPAHGMEFRPCYLARQGIARGHQVTIVAASYSHLRSVQPAVAGPVTEEVREGIRYLWLRTPAYRRNGEQVSVHSLLCTTELQYAINTT